MNQTNPLSHKHASTISSTNDTLDAFNATENHEGLDFLISSMIEGYYVPTPEDVDFYTHDTHASPESLVLTQVDKMAIAPFEFQVNENNGPNMPILENDPIQIWDSLAQDVLPIFIGKSILKNIEHYNGMVKVCLNNQLYGTVLESVELLLQEGMQLVVLQFYGAHAWNVKLDVNLGLNSKLFLQFIEIWTLFWRKTLCQIEAIFIPLQNAIKNAHLVGSVRDLALRTFREKVIFSQIDAVKLLVRKLCKTLEETDHASLSSSEVHQVAVLLQMLLVLSDLKEKDHHEMTPLGISGDEEALEKLVVAKNELSLAVATFREKEN